MMSWTISEVPCCHSQILLIIWTIVHCFLIRLSCNALATTSVLSGVLVPIKSPPKQWEAGSFRTYVCQLWLLLIAYMDNSFYPIVQCASHPHKLNDIATSLMLIMWVYSLTNIGQLWNEQKNAMAPYYGFKLANRTWTPEQKSRLINDPCLVLFVSNTKTRHWLFSTYIREKNSIATLVKATSLRIISNISFMVCLFWFDTT